MNESLIGTYKLAKQTGDIGFFAEVSLTIEPSRTGEKLNISFNSDVDKIYQYAVAFGIQYAFEKAYRVLKRNYSVKVTNVKGHVVDSTSTVLAYSAAKAFFTAIKLDSSSYLSINFDNKSFTFYR